MKALWYRIGVALSSLGPWLFGMMLVGSVSLLIWTAAGLGVRGFLAIGALVVAIAGLFVLKREDWAVILFWVATLASAGLQAWRASAWAIALLALVLVLLAVWLNLRSQRLYSRRSYQMQYRIEARSAAVVSYSLTVEEVERAAVFHRYQTLNTEALEQLGLTVPARLAEALRILPLLDKANAVAAMTRERPSEGTRTDDGVDRDRLPVDCTVFARKRVRREEAGLVQVFLHQPLARKDARARAQENDAGATERGSRILSLDAPIGTLFRFEVEIEGFAVAEATQVLVWSGAISCATFAFRTPRECKLGTHVGAVRVSMDGVPVGRIDFLIDVVEQVVDYQVVPVSERARRYRKCFCSYAAGDRVEAFKRIQGIKATGLETFVDVLTLRPGDRWSDEILTAIENSDLFVVIWSQNAPVRLGEEGSVTRAPARSGVSIARFSANPHRRTAYPAGS